MSLRIFIFLLVLISSLSAFGQKDYKVGAIGFYNLENLFDTLDSPNTRDSEYTPTGSRGYGTKIYNEKLVNLSFVISQLGTDLSPDGVAILGVAEIENRSVLEDLVKMPTIKDRNYQIVHYQSPDERGIDVGLLYNPAYFNCKGSKALKVHLPSDNGDEDYTRDILWVWGLFDGEPMHFFVNHWPSRSGGEQKSSPLRETAAAVARVVIDSLLAEDTDAKILVMGDMNDDPISTSVRKVLKAKGKQEEMRKNDLFNPWAAYNKKGIGTLAYRDSWNLFDQVIISSGLLDKSQKGFFYHQAVVFNKPFLVQKTGRYKGYPFRSYSGPNYQGGYSDHYPVFLYLLKEVN